MNSSISTLPTPLPLPADAPTFLTEHLPSASATVDRPHITVTWAQSLDSKIAGPGGKRVMISGPESMLMTHWLRAMHDAILIGVNTLILDDPRLQANLLPESLAIPPPQPLILDPRLRFPLSSRILAEWNERPLDRGKKVKQPWIICGDDVSFGKMEEVESAGARVVPVPLDEKGHIPPSSLPAILTSLNLRSVMIEGGSKILSSFLHAPTRGSNTSPSPSTGGSGVLVDSVVVTVGPMFIGDGIGVVPEGEQKGLPPLKHIHTETMGKDSVMVCSVE
ncbi:2,5-diamino-6-(ribosylamino)-4(3H)-pyrimidinone 5'-phosphate reductase [Kwoniella heveanensis BCC8398]|uniref:2,5-diamino-6-ribosylamino-4(3H)-pyrimidinone 5'-phosphate reductase n=1 Tax=Kwoniella heveanensis BCC8398 TaxID=1296120 RepID=A0A1B9GLA4_9TREE|nr:2,5-diamino-6-(ribosylamino)-4(3H)-pyrimidinone 5'-phosphate reductase [Kwoniella heveanensis BCC8398]